MPVSLSRDTQFIKIGQATIACDLEPAHNEPQKLLVLLCGFQRPRADFRSFRRKLHKLAPNIATIAIDNLGSGESYGNLSHSDCTPSIETMAKHASFVAKQFCELLSIEHYSALGISMGGMIAQSLALTDSNVSNLILVSTAARNVVENPSHTKSQTVSLEDQRQLMEKYFGPKFLKASPILFDAFLKNTISQQNSGEYQEKSDWQREAIKRFNLSSRISENHSPTLIITGNEDQIVDSSNSHFLKAQIPLSQLVIFEGVGHLVLIENPIGFTEDVARFLE